MKNLLTETGIRSPNWEKIGSQLGWQLEGQLSAADFFEEWHANDHEASWVKLAKALAKIQEYQHAESIVLEKKGMFVQLTSCDKIWITYNLNHVCSANCRNVLVSPQSRRSVRTQW